MRLAKNGWQIMDCNKLYKIKPLVWERGGHNPDYWLAESPIGWYGIFKMESNKFYLAYRNERQVCPTLSAAQAAADAHNAETMLPGLEEVTND